MMASSTITIYVPHVLRDRCQVGAELAVSAATVRAVLKEIEERYPALYNSVCDETGAVRRHVNLFVNSDHMRVLQGLDTELKPGDSITILPAVSGG